jgi:hypothetical protein
MTIPVTQIHILRMLLQADQNLSGLQGDMRRNALTWRAAAVAQSQPVATLAQWMNDAAAAYQTRIGWISTAQADAVLWPKLSALWTLLGGTAADFSNVTAPLKSVADQLGPIAKGTYAQIIGACDQIIAAINAPLSLWPE